MNRLLKITVFLLLVQLSFSQEKPCEYDIDVVTDTSSTRVLKEKIIDENVFGNTTSFLTFKLFDVDGFIGLNFQYLQKSKDFLTPICIDKSTKIFLEMANGKQVKLINSLDTETCNDLQYDAVNKNNLRILSGFFYFTPENFEDLKTSKVYLIKIVAATGDVDFVIKPELNSEIYKDKSNPDSYFINYFKCLGIK